MPVVSATFTPVTLIGAATGLWLRYTHSLTPPPLSPPTLHTHTLNQLHPSRLHLQWFKINVLCSSHDWSFTHKAMISFSPRTAPLVWNKIYIQQNPDSRSFLMFCHTACVLWIALLYCSVIRISTYIWDTEQCRIREFHAHISSKM